MLRILGRSEVEAREVLQARLHPQPVSETAPAVQDAAFAQPVPLDQATSAPKKPAKSRRR